MKKLLFILLTCITIFTQAQCPAKGGSSNAKKQAADVLKNRSKKGEEVALNLADFLADGKDNSRFDTKTYGTITGYLSELKHGGPESCNCNTADKTKHDIHVYVSLKQGETNKSKMMIVELSPYSYTLSDKNNYDYLQSILGSKVEITGWLFFDEEHSAAAKNTAKKTTAEKNIWRKTCWELHPVTKIVKL